MDALTYESSLSFGGACKASNKIPNLIVRVTRIIAFTSASRETRGLLIIDRHVLYKRKQAPCFFFFKLEHKCLEFMKSNAREHIHVTIDDISDIGTNIDLILKAMDGSLEINR